MNTNRYSLSTFLTTLMLSLLFMVNILVIPAGAQDKNKLSGPDFKVLEK